MKVKNFFLHPKNRSHIYYEALRAHFVDGMDLHDVALRMKLSPSYLVKIKREYQAKIAAGLNPFFSDIKMGPKVRHKGDKLRSQIVEMRKKNLSIIDIKAVLDAQKNTMSLDAINNLLKEEGFERLPRRTRSEKSSALLPSSILSPEASLMDLNHEEEFTTGKYGGVLAFLPLIESLGVISAIEKANFPSTSQIPALSYVLSFLALKLSGNKRLSHDEHWSLDRVLGLFAGLNVLPKSSSLSSYSYRVSRSMIKTFLVELNRIFSTSDSCEFNLDFKTIPHWGDTSVLEKNYSTTRGKSVKSVLALIVQNITDDCLAYTDAEISRRNEKSAVLEFVDFWKESHKVCPKMLIFDSQFTIHKNLSLLNQDGIKFITLRSKSQKMMSNALKKRSDVWTEINIEAGKRSSRILRYYEEEISINDYEGVLRQLVILSKGDEPVFIITNDFDSGPSAIVRKYARRWLVEQEISEQVSFFHLNQLSSSMAIKVDFDLALSLLAHNLYRKIAIAIPKYEKCTAETLHRNFVEGRAHVKVGEIDVKVSLAKKANLPLLFETPWVSEQTEISFLKKTISFEIATTS